MPEEENKTMTRSHSKKKSVQWLKENDEIKAVTTDNMTTANELENNAFKVDNAYQQPSVV